MGDLGKGDAPNSSDGVVPYWSSHMDGAKSELIVSSGHAAHQNPKAIEEVHRILTLNVGLANRAKHRQTIRRIVTGGSKKTAEFYIENNKPCS